MGEIHIKMYHLHTKKMAAKITNIDENFSIFLIMLMGKQKAPKKKIGPSHRTTPPPPQNKIAFIKHFNVLTQFVNQFIIQHISWQK